MTKKIAVILRGHLRTWYIVKDYILSFWESQADRVDYYAAIWDTGVDRQRFIDCFQGRNLQHYLFEPTKEDNIEFNQWTNPAYLSKKLTPYILEEEYLSGQKYEYIVDTRPDVFFDYTASDPIPEFYVGKNTVATTFMSRQVYPGRFHGMFDLCFMAESTTHLIWCARTDISIDFMIKYREKFVNLQHTAMLDFAKHHCIYTFRMEGIACEIVRPNILQFKDEVGNIIINGPNVSQANVDFTSLKISERKEYLRKLSIPELEYQNAIDPTFVPPHLHD